MIPLFKPYMPEIPEIMNILNSGHLAYGVYGKEFEHALSLYLDTKNIITTNSFNMAISVVLECLGIRNGDEIILSPMACLASTQPLISSGIKVRWADIDPAIGTLCPDSVRKRITQDTKAIIHNHYCGYIGYVDEINEIGREYGIPVIDDCIEAFGGEYKGRTIGNLGTDITIFSFNAVRIPNTIDGGAVVFKNEALYEKSKMVRDCGIDRSKFRDNMGEINPNFDITTIGYSATMNEISSYIGIQQLKNIKKIISEQRNNAITWDNILRDEQHIHSIKNKHAYPNYWVYGVKTNNKLRTIEKYRKNGFYASGVHINNNIYSIFGEKTELEGVRDFNNGFVAIPCGWWVDNIK